MSDTSLLDNLTMEAIRALDDDRLRVLIARILGWRVELPAEVSRYGFDDDDLEVQIGFVGFSPERLVEGITLRGPDRERYVVRPHKGWKDVFSALPDWPCDLDAACDLLEEHMVGEDVYIERTYPDGEHPEWGVWVDCFPRSDESDSELARAICLAWLHWKKEANTNADYPNDL